MPLNYRRFVLRGIFASLCYLLAAGYAAQAQQCMKDATDGLAKTYFFASGDSFGEEYDRAFNNNNNAGDKWFRGGQNSSVATPNFIGVNFGNQGSKTITGYVLAVANDFPSRDPRDWQFQGSNDGLTWTTLDTRSNQTFAYRGQSRLFTFSNTTPYLWYRILITETSDPAESSVALGEIELFERVCLEGTVTNEGAPLGGVTVAMMGETYSVGAGGGTVLRTATTDGTGKYSFAPADIPDGQFSLIVQPPAGFRILSQAMPFFVDPTWVNSGQRFSISQHFYTYDGSITFQNHQQLNQSAGTTGSVLWDGEQSFTYLNRFLPASNKGALDFTLKAAVVTQACATLNGSTDNGNNLITVAQNGTFGKFPMGTGPGSYVRAHPGQPGFSKDYSNTVLYGNEGYVPPTNTSYSYNNKANINQAPTGWGSGVLIQEGRYTVTSYIGTGADLIDGNNGGTNATSLINVFQTGWRKTYGATTGDVYDKFLVINGAGNNLPLFTQPGLVLKGGFPYLFSFDGKNANMTTQGINTHVSVPYNLLNASNAVVASGTLTLPFATTLTDDDPASPWQKVFATIVPPSDGTYTLEIRYPGGSALGNDFYLDNISFRALTDYGDNPISYSEAMHGQPTAAISASCDPLLFLGNFLDIENAYTPSAQSDGDDLNNLDDEDGVTFPPLQKGMTAYTATVKVTNLTGTAATLYGWMDWNNNGTFESGERVSVPVPTGTSGGNVSLTWNGIAPAGQVYARFRLGSDAAAGNPGGLSSGGEVEDYLVPFSTIAISGHVFHDANGNTDGIVNGSGTNTGTTLYAVLYDQTTGAVFSTTTVAPDGTFTLDANLGSHVSVYITTTPATIGQTAVPAVTTPVGWIITGENNCGTTPGCTGNDGTPNAVLSLGTLTGTVTEANFGLQQPPVAFPETQTIPQPSIGQKVTLNGAGSNPPIPEGSDIEDGPLGSGNTLLITTLPTNSTLLYNGTPVTSGQVIPNFNPSKLEVLFTAATVGTTSTAFQFAYQDAGNAQSPPATYTLNWSSPLPVSLVSFDARVFGQEIQLLWSTSSEKNNAVFDILHSVDAKNYEVIGHVTGKGTSTGRSDYTFIHANPAPSLLHYYRLRQVDFDGKYTLSSVRSVQWNAEAAWSLSVYPNPVKGGMMHITLQGIDARLAGESAIRLLDLQGHSFVDRKINIAGGQTTLQIPVEKLSPGVYFVQMTIPGGSTRSYRIIVL